MFIDLLCLLILVVNVITMVCLIMVANTLNKFKNHSLSKTSITYIDDEDKVKDFMKKFLEKEEK